MFSMSTLFLLLENSENVLSRFSTICSMSKFFSFSMKILKKFCPSRLKIGSMSRLFFYVFFCQKRENTVNVLSTLSFNMFHVKTISFARKYCK